MSLNRKIAAILLAVIGLILLSGWILQATVNRPMMRDLARREVEANATRCVRAIGRELAHLESMARDWAHWRETYDFLELNGEQYRAEYLNEEILGENNFDVALFIHRERGLVWAVARETPTGPYRATGSANELNASIAELGSMGEEIDYQGVLSTAGGIMLVATERVRANAESASNGRVIIGRYFDDPLLMEILDTEQVEFGIVPLTGHGGGEREFEHEHAAGEELARLMERLETNGRLIVEEDGAGFVNGWQLIRDYAGRATVLLHFRQTEEDFAGLRNFEKQSWLARVGMGLVILLAMQLALRRVVLRPMGRLREFVRNVRNHDDLSLRCPVQGGDEFAMLAAEMNRTLDSLEAARGELIQARDKAEAAAQAKSEFLAVMSHEIRTPLNGVIGMLGLLQESRLDHEQRECIEVAAISADTLLTVINEILDFSKMESRKLEIEEYEFHLPRLMATTMEIVQHQADLKRLEMCGEIDPATPEGVMGDSGRLRQILLNLLNNAIKFTEKGRIVLEIRPVQSRGEIVRLRFEVNDTGEGIPAERQEALFQPFVQIDSSSTRRHGGTGLGLAICRRLVEQMNGSIGVESEAGKGSTFWFELEFKTVALQEEIEREANVVAAPRKAARPGRVLVAEDNSVNQKVIRRMLQKLGYYADVVGDGREALTALAEFPYDLVLMDCHMPEMDGFEATQAIRKLESGTRKRMIIIALTADALVAVRERCAASGMDDYLTKPLTLAKLETTLAKYLCGPAEGERVGAAESVA